MGFNLANTEKATAGEGKFLDSPVYSSMLRETSDQYSRYIDCTVPRINLFALYVLHKIRINFEI